MPNVIWIGRALTRKQRNTITPGAVSGGDTFTVSLNSKDVTYTATGATVAEVTAGLVALLNAVADGDFREITWTDQTTHVQAEYNGTDGKPFTQTSSSVGGTLVTATTITASSPNDVGDADNWDTGVLPTAGDTVIIDGPVSLLWNAGALSAVGTLAAVKIRQSFTGEIGLRDISLQGYREYRAKPFAFDATVLDIGDGIGTGSGFMRLNSQAVQTTGTIYATGTPANTDLESLHWKGTHAANVVQQFGGSLGVAVFPGEVATILTLKVLAGAACRCGPDVTLATPTVIGGQLDLAAAPSGTLTQVGGGCIVRSGSVVTWSALGSNLAFIGGGNVTTMTLDGQSFLDLSGDSRACTITTLNIAARKGAGYADPNNRLTITNYVQV